MRFIKASIVVLIAVLVSLANVGCKSQDAAFAEAATPLGNQISAKFAVYINGVTDDLRQSLLEDLNTRFVAAYTSGDRPGTATIWFSDNGVREEYVNFLTHDPRYNDPDGQAVLEIQMNNVGAFDYIVSLGK